MSPTQSQPSGKSRRSHRKQKCPVGLDWEESLGFQSHRTGPLPGAGVGRGALGRLLGGGGTGQLGSTGRSERREDILGGEDSPSNVRQWEYRNRLTYKGAEEPIVAIAKACAPGQWGRGCWVGASNGSGGPADRAPCPPTGAQKPASPARCPGAPCQPPCLCVCASSTGAVCVATSPSGTCRTRSS